MLGEGDGMRIKKGKEKEFEKYMEINSHDNYSLYTSTYAVRWAELMEQHIDNGEKIADFAQKTSCEADTEGITGFMYGCAVNALSQLWEYGEELRVWHNAEYDYCGDGVVNPAVLGIG